MKALIAWDPTLPAPAEMAPAATGFTPRIMAPVPAPMPAAVTACTAAAPIGVMTDRGRPSGPISVVHPAKMTVAMEKRESAGVIFMCVLIIKSVSQESMVFVLSKTALKK
jgi:hypothetical protein